MTGGEPFENMQPPDRNRNKCILHSFLLQQVLDSAQCACLLIFSLGDHNFFQHIGYPMELTSNPLTTTIIDMLSIFLVAATPSSLGQEVCQTGARLAIIITVVIWP